PFGITPPASRTAPRQRKACLRARAALRSLNCPAKHSVKDSPMSSAGSLSPWNLQLKARNREAAQKLWERYFQRLVGLARARLQAAPRQAADEEDVARSACDGFCRGTEPGRFPQVHDQHDLSWLLVMITARRAFALRRSEGRQKRGGKE